MMSVSRLLCHRLHDTRSFTKWEQLSSRELLPMDERTMLQRMPKFWELEGSIDAIMKEDEQRDLPPLFDAFRRAAAALALHPRAGAGSSLRTLSADLIEKVCGSLGAGSLADLSRISRVSTMLQDRSTVAMLREHRGAPEQGLLPDTSLHDIVASNALMLKAEAAAAFSGRDYTVAANLYAQALGAIGPDCASEEDLALKVVLHSNVAEACLRVGQFSAAAHHAAEALKLDPAHDKSMRRLARALEKTKS